MIGVTVRLFAAGTAGTLAWCTSMPALGGMTMPGGWTPSGAGLRMPGQSWYGAAASFLGMWVVMMAAMMLPSLVPMLGRYRQAVGGPGAPRLGRLTVLVGAGYFYIWTMIGIAVYALGITLAAMARQWPVLAQTVPLASGVVVLLSGAFQLTKWKARQLACCREIPGCGRVLAGDAASAWRHGRQLGLHCAGSCINLMFILPAIGIMDLRAMVTVAVAITAERLAPGGERIAIATGIVTVGTGLLLAARAAGLG